MSLHTFPPRLAPQILCPSMLLLQKSRYFCDSSSHYAKDLFFHLTAKEFHGLALLMGWSRCTTKTTQKNYFLLESQHNKNNSTLSCNPPSTSHRWLAEQVLLFAFLYRETYLRVKNLRLKGTSISPNEKYARKIAFLDNMKWGGGGMERNSSLWEAYQQGSFSAFARIWMEDIYPFFAQKAHIVFPFPQQPLASTKPKAMQKLSESYP